jgi:hypothetical protein
MPGTLQSAGLAREVLEDLMELVEGERVLAVLDAGRDELVEAVYDGLVLGSVHGAPLVGAERDDGGLLRLELGDLGDELVEGELIGLAAEELGPGRGGRGEHALRGVGLQVVADAGEMGGGLVDVAEQDAQVVGRVDERVDVEAAVGLEVDEPPAAQG